MQLGKIGVWTSARAVGDGSLSEAARLAEELGFGTFWLGGSPQLPAVRPLLAATQRIAVATGIVNVWQYEPERLAEEYALLAREFPARLLLGVGIGHPEATGVYTKPLSKMREFLDGLDDASVPVNPADRCIAALGPKMLDLSAARTRGTHPYFVSADHTRFARQRVGEGGLVAPELACVLDTDDERARDKARRYASMYLQLSNYTSNLLRFGFSEDDIAGGGSDRLIDAIVPHGTAGEIAAVVREHQDAGADHVCLQAIGEPGVPERAWTELASALIG